MARTVADGTALYAAAYQAKDAEAVGDLFEEDAIYSVTGYTVVGRSAIVEKVNETFSACDEIGFEDQATLLSREDGDYAFQHGGFRSWVVLADGTRHEFEGRQSNVLHRGPDGDWRIMLSHSSLL